jgi:hypothetical protein
VGNGSAFTKNGELKSGNPQFQAALLQQAGLYCSGQKTSLATHATAMVIRKQNSIKPERRKERRSLTALKVIVTIMRKLNMDHFKFHLISELGKKMERNGILKSDGTKRS